MTSYLERLIQNFADLIEDNERKKFIIFGSAAIILNGVDLGREPDDLDFFVSEATFENLSKRFKVKNEAKEIGEIIESLTPLPNVEIYKTFPGVLFDLVSRNIKLSLKTKGFPLGNLEYLETWKSTQGRLKDIKDLAKIKEFKEKQK